MIYTYENDMKEYCKELLTGKPVQVDEELWYYYLEVLPPVFMNKPYTFKDGQIVNASFGFAEGGPVVVFWSNKEGYFSRHSNPAGGF